MRTLEQIKDECRYGLTQKDLADLVSLSPQTLVCMKLSTPKGDSRPVMTAEKALIFIADLELNDLKDGHIRELWILQDRYLNQVGGGK